MANASKETVARVPFAIIDAYAPNDIKEWSSDIGSQLRKFLSSCTSGVSNGICRFEETKPSKCIRRNAFQACFFLGTDKELHEGDCLSYRLCFRSDDQIGNPGRKLRYK